jgi:exo-beta-1,3-glucanase (GH17 family)
VEKSAETPELSTHHSPIGHEGLWHSKHPPVQLPAYIQNIRNALMRAGHDESSAHALAIGAVRRWASGKGKVTPEVRQAAAKAVEEFEQLRASHA